MGLMNIFNNLPLPDRKAKLLELIADDDGAGIATFLENHPEAVKWQTGKPEQRFLFRAIDDRKYAAVAALMADGRSHTMLSASGAPPLLHALRAAEKGMGPATADDLALAGWMVAQGSSVMWKARGGRDFALCAVDAENIEAVEFLLQRGISATPVLRAAATFEGFLSREFAKELVPVLLRAGADANVTNIHGLTPLFYVQDIDTAKALVAHGADPEWGSGSGNPPWKQVKDAETRDYLRQVVHERVAKRAGAAMTGDDVLLKEFEKDIDGACHNNVAVKTAKRIRLKPQGGA